MSSRIPVTYTFGNHQHWVDLQWLWGYHVMPGSIRDMLHFCRETGAKGCVNFDGIGYERLAAEEPQALELLKQAIREGTIEPVGCSYGQPYGLFHGGESNIRQRIYGVRTAMRVLGKRPETFWEEEFDFYPQLPQMLRRCGFEFGSLFFQWTWHTPEVPKEDVPIVWWEAPDGSRILVATRNKLNLHQWPEDFDGLLDQLAATASGTASAGPSGTEGSGAGGEDSPTPLILQWLELMPTPDWMCRSEVLLPRMRELLDDPRFEIRMATLGQYLRDAQSRCTDFPSKKYSMDEVWHGMSLGKNGDSAPRASHECERHLRSAEAISSVLSLFGRPYADWDVYPVWEYEEAWRNLLAAQHHDNHECEGLCGHGAAPQYDWVRSVTQEGSRGVEHLARRVGTEPSEQVVFSLEGRFGTAPLGYAVRPIDAHLSLYDGSWTRQGGHLLFQRGDFRVEVDANRGRITRIGPVDLGPDGFPSVTWIQDKEPQTAGAAHDIAFREEGVFLTLGEGEELGVWLRVPSDEDVLEVEISFEPDALYDPGMNAGPRVAFDLECDPKLSRCDTPLMIDTVRPGGKAHKKYPEGDWMTSPQWFETVEGGFTSQTFVDFLQPDGSGMLVTHNGSQQWFLREGRIENLIGMIDPWDELKFDPAGRVIYRFLPHQGLADAERYREGQKLFGIPEWPSSLLGAHRQGKPAIGDMPRAFSFGRVLTPNVAWVALYREVEDFAGMNLESYAGRGMGYPFVARYVEMEGKPSEVEVVLAGPIAKAVRTNLMGEPEGEITPETLTTAELAGHPLVATSDELAPFGIEPQRLRFPIGAHEIVTLYLDIVPGRKQTRDLDAKRKIWARVHRVD